jgi:F1F0 ATPase subunit 2
VNAESLTVLAYLLLGLVLGLVYFCALGWNVRLYLHGSGAPLALSFHVLRILGTAALFVPIARTGALPLLSSLAGFQLTRIFAFRARMAGPEAAI